MNPHQQLLDFIWIPALIVGIFGPLIILISYLAVKSYKMHPPSKLRLALFIASDTHFTVVCSATPSHAELNKIVGLPEDTPITDLIIVGEAPHFITEHCCLKRTPLQNKES